MQGSVTRSVAYGSGAALMLAGLLATSSAKAEYEISGNIGVVSDYILWGITTPGTESDGPAVQGGLDFEHESGLYGGWWASSLGYGTDNLSTTVENDFYFGYAVDYGDFSLDFGILYYWYMDASESSGWEPYVGVGYGPFGLSAAVLATDTDWGNSGDAYFTATADFEIGLGFELGLLARFFTYEDSGKYIDSTAESGNFRHFDVTLSRQIGDTPATMFATYNIGGKDRDGLSQKDKVVIGFTYDFDIR